MFAAAEEEELWILQHHLVHLIDAWMLVVPSCSALFCSADIMPYSTLLPINFPALQPVHFISFRSPPPPPLPFNSIDTPARSSGRSFSQCNSNISGGSRSIIILLEAPFIHWMDDDDSDHNSKSQREKFYPTSPPPFDKSWHMFQRKRLELCSFFYDYYFFLFVTITKSEQYTLSDHPSVRWSLGVVIRVRGASASEDKVDRVD